MPQALGHPGYAIVVEGEFERPGHRFVGFVRGDETLPQVVRKTTSRLVAPVPEVSVAPAVLLVVVGRGERILADGAVGFLHVVITVAVDIGVSDDRVTVRADHDIRIRGIGPLGNPSAFAVHLHQRRNHTADPLRRHEQQPGMLGPESVPERVGIVRRAVVDLIVESAVIAAVLGKFAGVLQRAEKCRVKIVHILFRSPLERDFLQRPGPSVPDAAAHRGKGFSGGNFPAEVFGGLSEVNERRSDADFHTFGSWGEFDVAAHGGPAFVAAVLIYGRTLPGPAGRKRL